MSLSMVPLGKLVDFLGSGISRPFFDKPDGVPVLRSNNVRSGRVVLEDLKYWHAVDPRGANLKTVTPQSGDILVNFVNGSSKELGKSAMYLGVPAHCIVTTNFFIVRFQPSRMRSDYANYFFQSDVYRKWLYETAGFSGQGSFNKSDFSELLVPTPSLSEQCKIAEILRTWDEAIEGCERLLSKMVEQATWFRTDLFTGKVRLKGFSGEWRKAPLSAVLHEHGLHSEGTEEVFSVSVHKGLVNQIEHLGRSFAAKTTAHYNRVLPGDIVYTKSPTGDFPLGIIKQSKLDRDVIVSPLYGVFTPATPELGVIIDVYFRSPVAVRNYLAPLVQKGAKNTIAITNSRFLQGELMLPLDPPEQRAIAEILRDADAQIAGIERQVAAYQSQKRGLMQKLLTGEWRVPSETGGSDG